MSKKQILFVVFAALWFIFVGIYASHGQEMSKGDWVDQVGEHIGGWERPLTIDVKVNGFKTTVSIGLEDGTCNEYFVPNVREDLVLYRDCGEKEWNKLNP